MSDASLKALVRDLVRRYEQRHGLGLDAATMVERFGFAQAKALEAMLDGRMLRRDLGEVLGAVAVLEGDEEDARLLTRIALPMVVPIDDLGVMNDRLMRRIVNMERFLRRIGKMDDFQRWLESDGMAAEA